MTETFVFELDGPVGWLRLDRPEKLNAQTPRLWEELREFGRTLVGDERVRALVVIGNGRAFSAGIDLGVLMGAEAGGGFAAAASTPVAPGADPLADMIRQGQEAFSWLVEAPFPSVAAVRGYALGAGLQLALACDLRLVARGTKLGALEFRYGLLPDLGGTAWLPRVVGPAKAKELVFTAAQIDAEEALRIGLANRVVEDSELEAAARALAEELAAQPPLALRWSKRAIDDPARSLELAAEGQAICLRSQDFREAGAAFFEKRRPAYRGQ